MIRLRGFALPPPPKPLPDAEWNLAGAASKATSRELVAMVHYEYARSYRLLVEQVADMRAGRQPAAENRLEFAQILSRCFPKFPDKPWSALNDSDRGELLSVWGITEESVLYFREPAWRAWPPGDPEVTGILEELSGMEAESYGVFRVDFDQVDKDIQKEFARWLERRRMLLQDDYGPSPLGFSGVDVKDPWSLAEKLMKPAHPISEFLARRMPAATRAALAEWDGRGGRSGDIKTLLASCLNALINSTHDWTEDPFPRGEMRSETIHLLDCCRLSKPKRQLLNRLLLEDAYRSEVWVPRRWLRGKAIMAGQWMPTTFKPGKAQEPSGREHKSRLCRDFLKALGGLRAFRFYKGDGVQAESSTCGEDRNGLYRDKASWRRAECVAGQLMMRLAAAWKFSPTPYDVFDLAALTHLPIPGKLTQPLPKSSKSTRKLQKEVGEFLDQNYRPTIGDAGV